MLRSLNRLSRLPLRLPPPPSRLVHSSLVLMSDSPTPTTLAEGTAPLTKSAGTSPSSSIGDLPHRLQRRNSQNRRRTKHARPQRLPRLPRLLQPRLLAERRKRRRRRRRRRMFRSSTIPPRAKRKVRARILWHRMLSAEVKSKICPSRWPAATTPSLSSPLGTTGGMHRDSSPLSSLLKAT